MFRSRLAGLSNQRARNRITTRIALIEAGLMGDVKSFGGGVSEIRVDYGPGYRSYFARQSQALIVLLCGGDKDSQTRDIARAKSLAVQS